ncbi:hypothetical protein [Streptomyces sp. NPDC048644]|uniref:hypothetical protein n=1 Tax=Streptomyces sp. NPDC048644 TaxID=3365582 RepID=UPI003723A08B
MPEIRLDAEVGPGYVTLTALTPSSPSVISWSITRHAGGVDVVLFSGVQGSLTGEDVFTDTALPSCTDVVYEYVITRTDSLTEETTAGPVQYMPPEGCNPPTTGAVAGGSRELGCPERYTAAIHWRGGARPVPGIAALDRLTTCTWSRTLRDTSDAQIVVSKADLQGCCDALGLVEPWVHELTIYRDGDLVWQGPISKITERRGAVTIDAQDVAAWLDRLVNTWRIRYVDAQPDAAGRKRAPVTYIAWNILRLNMVESSLSTPPDYAGLMDCVVRRDPSQVVKFEKDGTHNKAIWTAYVGDIWRELAKRGLTWTAVGRSLLLRMSPTSSTRAVARLTLDDVLGDVELIKDGSAAATYAFATSQQDQDIEDGLTVGTGRTGTAYGRLDTLVKVQGQDTDAADLRQAARQALAGRYPAPIAISVPDGSQLSPRAPIRIEELVPGERIDVVTDTYCTPVAQGFALTDVEGSWSEGGEKIAITLVPLADIDEEVGQ